MSPTYVGQTSPSNGASKGKGSVDNKKSRESDSAPTTIIEDTPKAIKKMYKTESNAKSLLSDSILSSNKKNLKVNIVDHKSMMNSDSMNRGSCEQSAGKVHFFSLKRSI